MNLHPTNYISTTDKEIQPSNENNFSVCNCRWLGECEKCSTAPPVPDPEPIDEKWCSTCLNDLIEPYELDARMCRHCIARGGRASTLYEIKADASPRQSQAPQHTALIPTATLDQAEAKPAECDVLDAEYVDSDTLTSCGPELTDAIEAEPVFEEFSDDAADPGSYDLDDENDLFTLACRLLAKGNKTETALSALDEANNTLEFPLPPSRLKELVDRVQTEYGIKRRPRVCQLFPHWDQDGFTRILTSFLKNRPAEISITDAFFFITAISIRDERTGTFEFAAEMFEEFGISRSTAYRSLNTLKDANLISLEQSAGSGTPLPIYKINPEYDARGKHSASLVFVPNSLLKSAAVDPFDKIAFLTVRAHWSKNLGAFLKQATLARILGLNDFRRLNAAETKLENAGWLRVQRGSIRQYEFPILDSQKRSTQSQNCSSQSQKRSTQSQNCSSQSQKRRLEVTI